MAYRYRCNACRQTFITSTRNSPCPLCRPDRDYGSTFIEDVLDVTLAVASVYIGGSLVDTSLDIATDVVGSIFDW